MRFWCCVAQNSLEQVAKFQFLENFSQLLFVDFFALQTFEVESDRNVDFYRREEFREFYVFDVALYFRLDCSLEFVGALKQVLDGTELIDEFHSCLLAHARTTWNVVG